MLRPDDISLAVHVDTCLDDSLLFAPTRYKTTSSLYSEDLVNTLLVDPFQRPSQVLLPLHAASVT